MRTRLRALVLSLAAAFAAVLVLTSPGGSRRPRRQVDRAVLLDAGHHRQPQQLELPPVGTRAPRPPTASTGPPTTAPIARTSRSASTSGCRAPGTTSATATTRRWAVRRRQARLDDTLYFDLKASAPPTRCSSGGLLRAGLDVLPGGPYLRFAAGHRRPTALLRPNEVRRPRLVPHRRQLTFPAPLRPPRPAPRRAGRCVPGGRLLGGAVCSGRPLAGRGGVFRAAACWACRSGTVVQAWAVVGVWRASRSPRTAHLTPQQSPSAPPGAARVWWCGVVLSCRWASGRLSVSSGRLEARELPT